MEEISEEKYKEMLSKTKVISGIEVDVDFDGADDCASGACPVK